MQFNFTTNVAIIFGDVWMWTLATKIILIYSWRWDPKSTISNIPKYYWGKYRTALNKIIGYIFSNVCCRATILFNYIFGWQRHSYEMCIHRQHPTYVKKHKVSLQKVKNMNIIDETYEKIFINWALRPNAIRHWRCSALSIQ